MAKIPGVVPGQLRVVRRLGFCSPSCDRWRTQRLREQKRVFRVVG